MGEIQRFFGGIYRGFLRGGDIEVFFGRENKVLRGKKTRVQSPESRVQSPESRVQGPVQLLGYAKLTYST